MSARDEKKKKGRQSLGIYLAANYNVGSDQRRSQTAGGYLQVTDSGWPVRAVYGYDDNSSSARLRANTRRALESRPQVGSPARILSPVWRLRLPLSLGRAHAEKTKWRGSLSMRCDTGGVGGGRSAASLTTFSRSSICTLKLWWCACEKASGVKKKSCI